MTGAKVDPTDGDCAGTSNPDVANLDDLKGFDELENEEVAQSGPEKPSQLARPGKKKKKKISPELKAARRASKLRKLFRIVVLIGYFCLALLYLKETERSSKDSRTGVLNMNNPITLQMRDCDVTFEGVSGSDMTVSIDMGSSEDAFAEVNLNNVTVMPAPGSPLACSIILGIPGNKVLPSISIEGWRSVQTVNEEQCNFPFTVTGTGGDTNLTFYDCTYRTGSVEGGVGNGTLDDGFGPKSPWCSLIPSLSVDDMEAEDADTMLDFCQSVDQSPLISVTNGYDTPLDFGPYNTMTVVGAALDLKFMDVSAASIDISLSEGMIHFEHLNVLYNSKFETHDGDVTLVTSGVPAAFVNYTVGLADYCVSARNMTILASSNSNTTSATFGDSRRRFLEEEEAEEESIEDIATNSTADEENVDPFAPAYQSTGRIKVCYDDSYCASGYGTPTFNINAPWGALYLTQATSHTTVEKARNYNLAKGKSMDTPHFDGQGTFYLQNLRTWLNEDPDMDGFVTFDSYGPGQGVGKWLYSTNIAYHYFDPWILDFVSGGLLVPMKTDIRLRSIPSQCPYRSGWYNDLPGSIFDLGGVSNAFHNTIETTVRESVVLNSKDTPDSIKTKYKYVSPTNVKRSTMKLMDSIASVLALICSFVLSIILGIVGTGIAITYFKGKQKEFMVFLSAMDRYQRAAIMREKGLLSTFSIKIDNMKAAYEEAVKAKAGGEVEETTEDDPTDPASAMAKQLKKQIIAWFMPNPSSSAIPTPYQVIENIAEGRARQKVDSLKEFMKKIAVARNPSDPRMPPIDIKEFRERYHYFCFHRKYITQDIESKEKTLKKFGFALEATSGTHTDVFTRIRFKTPRENEADRQNGNVNIMPKISENSLQAFIRVRCIVTGLDNDFITTSLFNLKYNNYVLASAVDNPVPITKRAMLDTVNCPFERKTMNRVISEDSLFVIDFSIIKEPPSDQVNDMTVEDVFEPAWWKSDIMAVGIHCLMPVVIIVPLLYITFKCEAAKVSSGNHEWDGMHDLKYAPWRFLESDRYDLETLNLIFVIYGICLSGLCLVELFSHYAQMDFRPKYRNRPSNVFSYMRGIDWSIMEINFQIQSGRPIIAMLTRFFFQRFVINLGKFFLFLHVMYFALMFTWGILGAVLNPNKFLCYAAAAGTLLAFVGSQYKTLTRLLETANSGTGSGLEAKMEKAIKGSLATCKVGKFAAALKGISGNDAATLAAAQEAIEGQADVLLGENGFSDDIDLEDIFGGEIGESVKSEIALPTPWAEGVFAIAERDDSKKKWCVEKICEVQGVNFDPIIAETLIEITANDENQRKSALKKLFVAVWEVIVENTEDPSVLPNMPNPDLILAILELTEGECLRYCELFNVANGIPAFQILIAHQFNDETMKLKGIFKVLDYFQNQLSQLADIDESMKAMIRLVDGKELIVQDWSANSDIINNYEVLAKMLGMPKLSPSTEKLDVLEPLSVNKVNENRSFLLRYMTVTIQQRASLLLHMADELAAFANNQIFIEGATPGNIRPEDLRALKALCVGTDINVTAFATECGIDVALANSVAYLLSEDQKRGPSGEAKKNNKTMMGLLSAMKPSSQVGWMAQKARSTRTPKLMLGVISIALRKTDGLEVDESMETMVNDYAVLHFGGEEPRASLFEKKRCILGLLRFFTANNSYQMKLAAKELVDPESKEALFSNDFISLACLGAGFEEQLDISRVSEAIVGIFGSDVPGGASDAQKWLRIMMKQFEDGDDDGATAVTDGDSGSVTSRSSASSVNSTATAVVGRNLMVDGEDSVKSKVNAANRLAEMIERKDETNIGRLSSAMGGLDVVEKKKKKREDTISKASALLELKNKMPHKIIEYVIKASLPRMNVTDALMESVKKVLVLPWCGVMRESAWKDAVTEAAELLNMDGEVMKSSLGAVLPANEADVDADEGVATADEDIASFLSESGASGTDIDGAILFCNKWEVARQESIAALGNLSSFAERVKIPAFWPLMLATNNGPSAGNSIMSHIKHFMNHDLKMDPKIINILEMYTDRNHKSVEILKREMGWKGLEKGVKLFGVCDDMRTTLMLAAKELSNDEETYKDSASIAALTAFTSRYTKKFDFVYREEGDDGRVKYSVHFPEPGEFQRGENTITPAQIIANQCCIPPGYVKGLMSITTKGVVREELKAALCSMVGEQGLEGSKDLYIQPTGLNVEEVYARGFLSVATGGTENVEDLANACGMDLDLAEGLVRLTGSKAADADLCNYKTLVGNGGFSALTKWMGLDLEISAGLVSLVKQDKSNLCEINKLLSLGMKEEYLKALVVVSEVSTMNISPNYSKGFEYLKACIAPLAKIYGVKHRKSNVVSAFIIRVAQGDLSPIVELAPTLCIGRTSIPFVAGLAMLASPTPLVVEEGFDSDWLKNRHLCTAARLLSKDLICDETWLGYLLDAGRGLERGLEPLTIIFSECLGGLELTNDATFIIIMYLVKIFPKFKKKTRFNWKDARRDCECLSSLQEEQIFQKDLFSVLAEKVGCNKEMAHFFLAVSVPGHAMKSLSSVIDRYYENNVTMNPKEVVSRNLHVLISIAHGDEDSLRLWGRDCELLKNLGFNTSAGSLRKKRKIRKNSILMDKVSTEKPSEIAKESAMAPIVEDGNEGKGVKFDQETVEKEASPKKRKKKKDGKDIDTNDGEPLSLHSPLIFLVRLGHRDPKAFDIKDEEHEPGEATISETYINDKLMIPKAVFCLLNHNWYELARKPRLPARSIITEFMLHLCFDDSMGRALVALSTRGISCKENISVMVNDRADIADKYLGTERGLYGVRPRELMDNIVKVTKRIGGSGGMYARAFMAGASENPDFLEEALTSLCNKIGVGDIEIVVAMMKAVKGDQTSLASLAKKCCCISDTPIDNQHAQLGCIEALRYISNTSKIGYGEAIKNLAVLQAELFGIGAGEMRGNSPNDTTLGLAKNETNFNRPTGTTDFEFGLMANIDETVFQIVAVMHVGRNVLTQVKNVMAKVTAEFNLSAAQIKTLENMISLWNKSSAVFTNRLDGNSTIKLIDDAFAEKYNTPKGACAVFFSANNSVLDTVAANLKALALQEARGLKYTPEMPVFLLALKRDKILARDPTMDIKDFNPNSPMITVKAEYRPVLWDLMVDLSGGEDFLPKSWKVFDDGQRRKKMRLFMSMMTNKMENFQPLLMEMYSELDFEVLQEIQLMVTPETTMHKSDVEELSLRMTANADAGTKEWLAAMIGYGANNPIGGMLSLIGNSVQDVWSAFPLYLMKQSGMSNSHAKILETLFIAAAGDILAQGFTESLARCIRSSMSSLAEREGKTTDDIPEASINQLCSFVSFASTILQVIDSGSAERWNKYKAVIIESLAIAIDRPKHFANGFVGIAMNDLKCFGSFARMFQECEPQRLCDFEKVLIRLFPMKGLLPRDDAGEGEEGGNGTGGVGDRGDDGEEEDPFTVADAFTLMDTTGDGAEMLVFDEIQELLKLYQVDISEQEALFYFAKVDKDNSKTLSMDQWLEFSKYLSAEEKKRVMEDIGFDAPTLAGNMALNVFVLLLLFMFIFFGISGFAVAGSFGACINAGLPTMTGGGLSTDDLEEMIAKAKIKIEAKIKDKMGKMTDDDDAEGNGGDDENNRDDEE